MASPDLATRVAALAAEGYHLSAIATALNRSKATIHDAARRNRIRLPVGRPHTPSRHPDRVRHAVELVLGGHPTRAAAAACNISYHALWRALQPHRAQLSELRAAQLAAKIKPKPKQQKRPQKKRPRTAPKLLPTDPRCAYHDCMIPLPQHGVCSPGVGNPCCVARGPRVTYAGVRPWGWLIDDDQRATPDPATEGQLARLVQLDDAGVEYATIGREFGWSPWTARTRARVSGELYRRHLAILATRRGRAA
jgi:hypothetical protein